MGPMSQNPTTLSGAYVTGLKTMQCLPHVALFAEVSLSGELPAPVWKSSSCGPTSGSKSDFLSNMSHVMEIQIQQICYNECSHLE